MARPVCHVVTCAPDVSWLYIVVGSSRFVAIDNDKTTWTKRFTTSPPDAVYCDAITGKLSNGKCTGFR